LCINIIFINLQYQGEAETSSAGEQLVRNAFDADEYIKK